MPDFSENEKTKAKIVTANLYWYTENNTDLIAFSPTNATNNGVVNVSVLANKSSAKRMGVKTVLRKCF